MKDPKALFPFLFATSWLGNLLLTILAFYLAFTQDGPLTPLVFLTVAFCILAGNALPISVYLILVRWRAAELKAETAEASVLLREALARSEEVLGRLDEAEGALAKNILVSRQVPDRIRESLESVEALAAKLDTLQVASFTDALKAQSDVLGGQQAAMAATQAAVAEVQKGLKDVRKELGGVPAAMEKLLEQSAAARAGGEPADLDVSVNERLDLVFETLESVQDSLDGLLQRMAEMKAAPEAASPAEPAREPVVEAPALDELEDEPMEEVVEPEEEELLEEIVEELVEEPAEAAKPSRRPRKKASREEDQAEMELGLAMDTEAEAGRPADSNKTTLVAHAMVGIHNRIFIRGDQPWLSWDDGQPMELIGIGEFAWSIEGLKEPIEVTVLLNDELAAQEGTITLQPGQSLRITPRFPKA